MEHLSPLGWMSGSSAHWLVIVLLVAVAAALLLVGAAWINRRWRH